MILIRVRSCCCSCCTTPLSNARSRRLSLPDILNPEENGVLIDGTGGEPLRDAVVVIRKARFIVVGPRNKVESPSDGKVVDLQGAIILPGFINTHVHYGWATVLTREIQFGSLRGCGWEGGDGD